MRLCDLDETIQEIMESYENELDGKTYQGFGVYNHLFIFIVFKIASFLFSKLNWLEI